MLATLSSWLSTYLIHPLTGLGYQFWSGIGSDIGELAIIGALIQVIRHSTCHQSGCWRVGKHPHGPYKLCSRHHPTVPDGPVTAEHIESYDS